MRIEDLSQQNDVLIAKIKTYIRSVWIVYLATNPWLRPGYKGSHDNSISARDLITAKLGLKGTSKSKIVDEACETLYDFFPHLNRTGCRTLLMQRIKVSNNDKEMKKYFQGLEILCKEWLTEIDKWRASYEHDRFNVDAVLALEHHGRMAAMVGFWYRNSSMHGANSERRRISRQIKSKKLELDEYEFEQIIDAATNFDHCKRLPGGEPDSWPGGEPDFEMRYIIVHPVFTLARAILRREPALSSVLEAEYIAGAQLAASAERLAMTFSVGRPCILKVLPFGERWKRTLVKLGFSIVKKDDDGLGVVHMKKRITSVPKVHHEILAYLACPWFGFYTSKKDAYAKRPPMVA